MKTTKEQLIQIEKMLNEGHGLSAEDKAHLKRIINFLLKSNITVKKTKDLSKKKNNQKQNKKITKEELQQIIKEEITEILGSRKKKRPFHIKIGERVMASVFPGKYGDHGGVLPGTIIATSESTRKDAPEWFEYRDNVEQNKYEKAVDHVNSRMLNKDESDEDYMRDAKWLETSAPQPAMAPVGAYPAVKLDIGVIDTFHLRNLEGTSESTATDGPTGLHQGYFSSNQS